MKRILNSLVLLTLLLGAWCLPTAPAAAHGARQEATPLPEGSTPPQSRNVQDIIDRMSVADKVGQLFVVTFEGNDVSENSDIASLVRDYRVGGVVLLPANRNFSDVPVQPPVADQTGQISETSEQSALSTPQQIALLTSQLQTLAMSPARPITQPISSTETTAELGPYIGAATAASPVAPTSQPAKPQGAGDRIPLLVGVEWTGDDNSIFSGSGGFTPLPSAMAMGATWTPALAEKTGHVLGQELRTVGINLLLGPPMDVLDAPRPGSKGDLGTRTFGGDPFWVGQMGRGFIRGVQTGGGGAVVTAATHFPGQGGSDRRPEDEVATVQKSVQQLRQIELAPFAAVTAGSDLSAPGTTALLMTSHIRYRGFQGNIRQLTPPISLAPQLQDLMALKEFADWRAAGGVLLSDALGVPAIRRYYDPQLLKFPHRQVAQDAFLAGNDLLFTSRFALTDNWPDQFAAIRETILFFQSKYQDDGEFRARVDAAVERILRLKQRIYPEGWPSIPIGTEQLAAINETVGREASVTHSVARAAISLIYPGRDELADRMPSGPLQDESILIITDSREVQECSSCPSQPLIGSTALRDIILRLYGPSATGQVVPGRVQTLTFSELNRFLGSSEGAMPSVENAINLSKWIIFAHLNYNPEDHAASGALRSFLAQRSDSLRDKRIVVMSFDAPYYLDTTEISKLTAYFGVYGNTAPFLETAVRALFREFSPVGAPPVTITGINYVLINQLEPAPGQIITLAPAGAAGGIDDTNAIRVGSTLELETGVILDHNGHPVPDGTPVEFHLRYPTEALQLAPMLETTTEGQARTQVVLDRPGELWITARSGEAKDSTRIVLKVGGDAPGSIATVVPTQTSLPTPTLTPQPSPTVTLEPSATPTLAPLPEASASHAQPRVALTAFFYGLIGVFLSSGTAFTLRRRAPTSNQQQQLTEAITAALWAVSLAWVAYLLYSLGWLPGATQMQASGKAWAAGVVTLVGGSVSMLWTAKTKT